jgi:anti-sigma regulatory factor (Ser/Thr protein kinase)
MSRSPWAARPTPHLDGGAARVWTWELRSRRDLTLSRIALREDLQSAAGTNGVAQDDVDRLLLAYEELASNGLRHGRSPVQATVTATATGWLIDVSDAATTASPVPAVDRDPALGGMGLHLVAHLSSTQGWAVRSGRKHVWACVPRLTLA